MSLFAGCCEDGGERRMPVRHPGAASAGPTGPGAASGVNPRLPRRATRDGQRGARTPSRHSSLPQAAAVTKAHRGAVVVSGWLVRGDLLGSYSVGLTVRVGRASDSPRAIPTLRVGPLAAGSRRHSWVESPPRAGYPLDDALALPARSRGGSSQSRFHTPFRHADSATKRIS